jgi:hypothetical protein
MNSYYLSSGEYIDGNKIDKMTNLKQKIFKCGDDICGTSAEGEDYVCKAPCDGTVWENVRIMKSKDSSPIEQSQDFDSMAKLSNYDSVKLSNYDSMAKLPNFDSVKLPNFENKSTNYISQDKLDECNLKIVDLNSKFSTLKNDTETLNKKHVVLQETNSEITKKLNTNDINCKATLETTINEGRKSTTLIETEYINKLKTTIKEYDSKILELEKNYKKINIDNDKKFNIRMKAKEDEHNINLKTVKDELANQLKKANDNCKKQIQQLTSSSQLECNTKINKLTNSMNESCNNRINSMMQNNEKTKTDIINRYNRYKYIIDGINNGNIVSYIDNYDTTNGKLFTSSDARFYLVTQDNKLFIKPIDTDSDYSGRFISNGNVINTDRFGIPVNNNGLIGPHPQAWWQNFESYRPFRLIISNDGRLQLTLQRNKKQIIWAI